jgi:catechol 2,3-dioxygenase-like lactoylglutathione lyase family enzyme
MKRFIFMVFALFVLSGCKNNDKKMNKFSYELGVVAGFSELVNAGVKRLALSSPMTPNEMDRFVEQAETIAAKHNVSVYRETNLIITDLFPSDIAEGKHVLLLYQGTTLDEYFELKNDFLGLKEKGLYYKEEKRELSRRFGRLLSYSPKKINQLLAENTSFKTIDDFGIKATNLFLYYDDLKKAGEFYTEILGMELVADYGMALILKMAAASYLVLVDAGLGAHSSDEPKTVALALLTDQLEEWYSYLKQNKVEIKYDYKPKQGSAHDGFVAVDPEGYLLEFERFNQHPENEKFIPLLKQNIENSPETNLGIHSTITWLYYKNVLAMQNFFQDVLGLEMVADQGWTKIYKVSETGFLAIVDEKRGMHNWTEKKAVNIGFIVNNLDFLFEYVKDNQTFELRDTTMYFNPDGRYKAVVGFCPENYYLEFNEFLEHELNETLLSYLNSD